MTIKAVTFDLWDTIVADDSDEPKRAARGLRSKREERRHLLWTALDARKPIDLERVSLAYDVADAGFNLVWKELHINWTLEQRLRVVLNGLGRSLPAADLARVVEATGRMEVEIAPDPIDGIACALAELARRYRLAVVSDAIVTPGTNLRAILEKYDLLRYFGGFAFSDEVGRAKPHRSMFEAAAVQLGVELDEMVHVGDREQNDVKGPHAIGIKAVLFTATRPDDRHDTTADAICERHADLPGVIDRLAAASAQEAP
jgi:HAD superfamily hydrolase (TIGR01549 family)